MSGRSGPRAILPGVTPWVRVLGVFVLAVLAALLLKVLPPLVVLLLFVGGFTFANLTLRKQVRSERPAGAELLGLRREDGDPFGLLAYPVELFGRLPEPSIDELVWGPWRGLDVHVFAVSFDAPAAFETTAAQRLAFGCAMARIPEAATDVVAEPQTFLTMLARPPAGERVETGDEAFDDAMHAWSSAPDAARGVLDAPTREWLHGVNQRWGVEIRGTIALVYGPKPSRPDVVAVLETLRELVDHVSSGATERSER